MTRTINKSLVVLIIITLITTMFMPIQASAAESQGKTFTKNGVKMQYKQKVVKNKSLLSSYAKDLRVVSATNKATLKWNKVSGASGYFVLYSRKGNGTYKQIARTSKTSYTDRGLKKNKSYYYVVYPYKKKGGKYYIADGCTKVVTRTTNSTKKPDTVKGAYLNKSSTKISVGDIEKLKITYKGSPFSTWTRWYSSNTKIATVDSKGKVTAKSPGTTTITAKRPSGYNLVCKITVVTIKPEDIEVDGKKPGSYTTGRFGSTLQSDSTVLNYGESKKITYTIIPWNATDKSVTLKSSDPSLLSVNGTTVKNINTTGYDEEVTLTIIANGNKNVKVEIQIGCYSKKIKATSMNINTNADVDEDINSPSFGQHIADRDEDGIYFEAKLSNENANVNYSDLKFESSNDSIATFLNNGPNKNSRYIQINTDAKKVVTLTITDQVSGLSKKETLWVNKTLGQPKPVKSISLNQTSASLQIGGTMALRVTFSPTNVNDNTITWSSSNTSVATVENGVVTGKNQGTTTITAKSTNGKTATCKVTVNPIVVTSVSLNKSSMELNVGDSNTLTATISPSNATNKTVTWSSSNSSVASVSNGKITGVAEGTATITAKSNNGKTATCSVKVVRKPIEVESVTFDKTRVEEKPGKAVKLVTTVSPSNAANQTLTWSSSNEAVAKITSPGWVSTKGVGEATITATSINGKKATCKFVVSNDITAINIKLSRSDSFETIDGTVYKILNWNSEAGIVSTLTPTSPARQNLVYHTDDTDAISLSNTGHIKVNTMNNRWVKVWVEDTYSGVVSNELRIHLNPTGSDNADPSYKDGTKNTSLGIEIGQQFNMSTMTSKFGSVTYSYDIADKSGKYGTTTVYCFSRNNTYRNYVELYVCQGYITGWFTNATEKVTFGDGVSIKDETNTGAKLGKADDSSFKSYSYRSNNTPYSLIVFKDSPINQKNIATGVWRGEIKAGYKYSNRYHNLTYEKHMMYVCNALRGARGIKPVAWLDKLEPALKIAVESWREWGSLENSNGDAHLDKYGRDQSERVKEEANINSYLSLGENAYKGATETLYEFGTLGVYWRSDGGSVANYEGAHKANLFSGKNANYPYIYIYTTSNGYNGMLFVGTNSPQ